MLISVNSRDRWDIPIHGVFRGNLNGLEGEKLDEETEIAKIKIGKDGEIAFFAERGGKDAISSRR